MDPWNLVVSTNVGKRQTYFFKKRRCAAVVFWLGSNRAFEEVFVYQFPLHELHAGVFFEKFEAPDYRNAIRIFQKFRLSALRVLRGSAPGSGLRRRSNAF